MKRITASLMIVFMSIIMFAGCADTKVIAGVEYNYYGLFNKGTQKNPNVEYRVVAGNVVWGILLVETVVAPVVIGGWFLWEPVAKIDSAKIKGVVTGTKKEE